MLLQRKRVQILVSAAAFTLLAATSSAAASVDPESQPPSELTALSPAALGDLLEHAESVPLSGIPGATAAEVPKDVQALANSLWDEQPEGFGDVQWDASARGATVWWHGNVPKTAQADIDALSSQARVAEMRYSRAELEQAAAELVEASGVEVETVAAKHDGTGLEVTVASSDSMRKRGMDLESLTSYPVNIVIGGEVAPAADDRKYTPYYPYAGGASIINGASAVKACSSGWPVLIDGPDPALPRNYGMAFASHCITNTSSNVWTTWPDPENSGARWYFGSQSLSTYRSGAADAAILFNDPTRSGINDPNKIYYPYIYVGPPSGASRYVVTDIVAPVIGANWCLSGAPSGTTCNNTINSTGIFADYGSEYPTAGPLVRTVSADGLANVGQGDSGGPAHRINTNGQPFAQVAGIISGIQNPQPNICRLNNDGRLCSSVALLSPFSLVQNELNVRAMTASNYNQ